ncbi:phage tail spike protein [Agathobacter sp.]|uniref:phage tail spike protein n=1 Tax=Agathobacter sp. TaxID=2021311 RepID=UPI003AB84D6B
MIPILYEAKTNDFTGNGTGFLRDATECTVKEVRNGTFELTLKYPENGVYADKLTEDAIIKAKPNNKDNDQLFRIYKSGKTIAGVNTFYAEHISYELNSNPICQPVIEGKNPQQAIEQVLSQAAVPNNYTAWSDIQTRNSTSVDDVVSVRKMLGGVEGSILDTWGGEYQFDNFTIKLWKSRGKDTGETIRYGKNLITAEQEKNISNTVTAIFPYARYKKDETSEEEILVKLSEGIIKTPNADRYARLKCEPVDFSDKFDDGIVITEDMLRKVATAYAQSGIDEPSISIKASFQDMNKIKGNENLATFNSIDLCDIVTVIIEKLGIDVKAKVVSYTYNVLKERAECVEIGETRTNLTKQITAESKEQADRIIKTATFSEKLEASLKQRIADATAAITGNSGGYVVLYPPENPQEIFVMDSPDTKTAKNVWRWNKAGLGHSSNGVNGPFNVAIQQDGTIIADFIGAGELNGMLIKAGTIKAESLSVEYKNSVTKKAQDFADAAENNANTATDNKLKEYSTTEEMKMALTVEAGKISSEVSKTYETKETVTQKITAANTAAQKAANQAESNANTATDEKLKEYSTTTQMNSAIEQTAKSIKLGVSETYETKETVTQKITAANTAAQKAANAAEGNANANLENYKKEANAAIELNAETIKSKVTADDVTSQIEQSAEAIRCQAKKISWKSENSEMTEDGKLSCQGAEISGTFKQVHGGKKSIDINNNEVKVFSWQNNGNFAGALGSVYVKSTGRDKVAFWCDSNDIVSIGCQQEEGDTPSANIDAVIQIDAKTYKEQTPWIRNTASGKLFPENKEGITVENGLIKGWDIEYASGTMSLISGLSWNSNGITKVERCNITIKNGIITGWNTTSNNY